MLILKKISIFSLLLIFSSNLYAHSVDWSLGSVIYIYALAYGPFILVSLLLAFLLPKLFKKKIKGIPKSFIMRTILSAIVVWVLLAAYFTIAHLIYRSGLATIKDIKELSIPIKKAYVSFCKENNRYPNRRNEIDNILNPMGFSINRPKFARTEYSNEDLRFNIEGGVNRNDRYTFYYYLKISSEIVNNYYLYFDDSCNFIGDRKRNSYLKDH